MIRRFLGLAVRFMARCATGLLAIVLFNVFGSWVGAQIPINVLTAATAGYLGLPGILLIVALQKAIFS